MQKIQSNISKVNAIDLKVDNMSYRRPLSNPASAADILTGKCLLDENYNIVYGTMPVPSEIEIITGTISYYNDTEEKIENIGNYAFQYCTSLTSVNFPVCTAIGVRAFRYCSSLTSVSFPVCTTIGEYAFHGCTSLTSVSFPACIRIGESAFYNCYNLTSVSFPACIRIGGWAFSNCTSLTSVSFPACTTIGGSAFWDCTKLASVNSPACTTIYYSAFNNCTSLTSLTLGASTVCTLANTNAFYSTPMSLSTYTGTFGSLYVPASLVDAYKSATNWATYSSRIGSME